MKRFGVMTRWLFLSALALSLASIQVIAASPLPKVQHIVIIGVDGMSPEGVEKAKTPHMHELMRDGTYTLHARGVMPTVSSPNWASMIMGAGPEQHGVTSNGWLPNKFIIAPTCVDSGGIFPTIFGLIREQMPSAATGLFTDWAGFEHLVEPKAPSVIDVTQEDAEATTQHALDFIRSKSPTFVFIHYDLVDHAGHTFGWGTPEYFLAVAQADQLLGRVLESLKEDHLAEQTVVLVTADHGGHGMVHAGNTMADIVIPWIISGPGIASGKELEVPVNTYDTAATVAWLLGLKTPECWIGRPVPISEAPEPK